MGNVLHDLGEFEGAAACFKRAVSLNPDLFQAHNSLGSALKQQGKFDDAMAHYEQAIAIQPDFAEAHFNRADLKTFRAGDPDLAALESVAVSPDQLPREKMVYIHFALGKALDDVGDYGRAFEHFRQGNALKRREVDYDEATSRQVFRNLTGTVGSSLFKVLEGAGDPSGLPIFVLGMPRSGSTLVEQILASHPQVHAAGELTNLSDVVAGGSGALVRSDPSSASRGAFDANGLRKLGEAYLSSLPPRPAGKTHVTDKAPGNFFHVGLIRLILPNAKIIHTMRDPMDTCVSCFLHFLTRAKVTALIWENWAGTTPNITG